ncbi:MAG: proprotein convertase P-domain-containing protein [Sphingorhabdus sp.]
MSISFILRPLLCAFFTIALPAHAQLQYTNSVDGPVNENATPCSSPLIRDFNVTDSFTVGDVDIGIMMNHTYRGDLLMWLTSPAGPRIQIFTGTGGTRNNFNVLLDDGAAQNVTAHNSNDTAGAGTTVPPYQRLFRPAGALTPFNGQNGSGMWRLEICDRFNLDAGDFRQADLFLMPISTNLSVTMLSEVLSDGVSSSNPKAVPGALVRHCITISNGGPATATSINADDLLPANTSYTSGSMRSGVSCGSAVTIEDDNAAGTDESDPIGASISGSNITITNGSLASGANMALIFTVIID